MSTAATAAALIIEVRQIDKFYAQADGTRVRVIAPTDPEAGDFYRDAQHRKGWCRRIASVSFGSLRVIGDSRSALRSAAIIPIDHTFFHDEEHLFGLAHIFRRIAGDGH